MTAPVKSSLDRAIEGAIAEKRIMGTLVTVLRDGEVIYRRAAGLADREAGRAMDETLVFRLASLTKPIVTAAAMHYVEAGTIRLDDPVTAFLPDFQPALPDGTRPAITLEHLLTHTSGLGYGFIEEPGGAYQRLGISDGLDLRPFGLAENLRRLAQAPLAFEPGSGWRYSLGIDVIGAVLEQVAREPLPAIVDRLVTGPLSMTDTAFHAREPERLATPYVDGAPEPELMVDGSVTSNVVYSPSRALDPTAYPSGGAGMVGRAADMLKFFEAMRTGGGGILKPETVAEMRRDRGGAAAQSDGPGWGFGLGWGVLADPAADGSPQAPGTLQWGGAYGHNWFIDPVNRLTVLALTNTALEGMWGQFKRDIRDAVYEEFGS
ncbi:serine hydrolase domain-containing protein [Devosia nitrariae]|uniref:Serine hydrolase n=1 Tax=Devosia nitrariae TaxID=2071872 RepID=A0ABQ5WBN1_9HYPH|nr:serine hydrolase domain-containing protein [Devosia nitrariae]GLQ57128.1 serine hydrolase [Devosia nitrariae]